MWDDRYSTSEYVYGKDANDFLSEAYELIPAGGRVLCLAEGEGRNAVFLAQKGFDVVAIDSSQVGLDKAQKLAQEKGVSITTEVADLADYELGENQWDGIVSIWVHIPKAMRQDLYTKVCKALKPNGIFLLEAYTAEQPKMDGVGGPPASQPDRFISLDILQNELGDLDVIMGEQRHREINEGTGHQGLSAVVRFIGVKP